MHSFVRPSLFFIYKKHNLLFLPRKNKEAIIYDAIAVLFARQFAL